MTQLGTKKSRRGCGHCKRRRVKCDEQVPCANCTRRGETCSLLYPATSERNVDGSLRQYDSAEWLQDLELMHQYTLSTSGTNLGGGQLTATVWGDFVPREAVKHGFLMHSVLAIAGLHLASMTDSEAERTKYLQICDKHQATALSSSRAIMANITDEVSAPLFAFSSLTSLSSLARSSLKVETMPEPRLVSVDEISETLALTRGIREVVAVSVAAILRGPMGALLRGFELMGYIRVQLPENIVDKFSLLQRMLSERCDETEYHAFCSNAVICLQDIYRNIFYFQAKNELLFGHIWRWTAMVDMGFIRLVQNSYQPALVVMTYFVITLQLTRHEWYLKDWGLHAFNGLDAVITEDFKQYLEWPREQLANDLAAFHQHEVAISPNGHMVGESPTIAIYRSVIGVDPDKET